MKRIFLLILLLFLLLFAGGVYAQMIVPFPGLGKPDSITIDDQRLYITDQATIAVYSLEDFKLKKEFGSQGEGPGEFRILPFDRVCLRISLSQDTILVNSVSRLSLFTKEGDFIKQMFSQRPIQYLKPLGDKMVGYHRWTKDDIMYIGIYIYDPLSLRREKELFKKEFYVQTHRAYDPTIFAMVMKNGARRATIYHSYENKLFVEGKIKQKVRFRDTFPIRSFLVSDDKIYVLTFKNIEEKSEFYVLDLKGTFLEKKMIPFAESEFLCAYPYTITNGALYQLNENPDTEEWELRVTNFYGNK